MKKVLTISIHGAVFQMDEDASIALKSYLEALNAHFRHRPGGPDVIQDIEDRMAELFQDKRANKGQVVTLQEVREVITVLGTPEAIAGYDADTETPEAAPLNGAAARPPQYRKPMKRLYRDPDRRALGGVCAGLSAYLNVDVVWIRLIFLLGLLVYGTTFLLYLIFWIVTPKAYTAAQKLEMRGEAVNVDNIERTVQSSYTSSGVYERGRVAGQRVGHAAGRVASGTVSVFGKFFGMIFFVGAILLFISLISALAFHPVFISFTNDGLESYAVTRFFSMVASPAMRTWIYVAVGITVLFPLLGLLLLGLKLLFNFRIRTPWVVMGSFLLWIVALISTVSGGLFIAKGFALQERGMEVVEVKESYDTLYFSTSVNRLLLANPFGEDEMPLLDTSVEPNLLVGRPRISFYSTSDPLPQLRIVRTAQGASRREAMANLNEMRYSVTLTDSLITLPGTFAIPTSPRWKGQDFRIECYVPDSTVVAIPNEFLNWFNPWDISYNQWEASQVEYAGRLNYFRMLDNRLRDKSEAQRYFEELVKRLEKEAKKAKEEIERESIEKKKAELEQKEQELEKERERLREEKEKLEKI